MIAQEKQETDQGRQQQVTLEICCDSVESCVAAERGGAQRVELCANLDDDGTTPGAKLVESARRSVDIALHVMIRPRGGDFCLSDAEREMMRNDIALARQLGADGVVLGLLTRERNVDVGHTRELVILARPMAVTFHRAFDAAVDPVEGLEAVIETGASRLLTSGQAPTAAEGAGLISRLVRQAGNRIEIMAGVGITAENAAAIVAATGAREIHVGSGATDLMRGPGLKNLFPGGSSRRVNPAKVARIREALASTAAHEQGRTR